MSGSTSSAPTATVSVLSQRLLLSLIASFQPGPPGVVAPLIQRLKADGHIRVVWCPVKQYISTPLGTKIRSKRAWAESVTPEAIARYDTEDFYALRTVLATIVFASRPAKATRRLLHRTTEAAAACGRVDMLQWLHDQHDVFEVQPLLVSFCVKLAVHHGQVAVVEWLEEKFPIPTLKLLDEFQLRNVVQRCHVSMIRWFSGRKLGVMPTGGLFLAVAQGDLALFHAVLTFHKPTTQLSLTTSSADYFDLCEVLAWVASDHQQREFLRHLVERNGAFSVELLFVAFARRDYDTAQCMLDNLQYAQMPRFFQRRVHQKLAGLVRSNDTRALEMIARADRALVETKLGPTMLLRAHATTTDHATMAWLVRMSPVHGICTVLMEYAMRGEVARATTLLAVMDRPLPPDVVGFVQRVTTDTLGPLASLAHGIKTWSRWSSGYYYPYAEDAHVVETMVHWLPSASQQDARDLLLLLLPEDARRVLHRVLPAELDRADGGASHWNREFLALCRSLRPNIWSTEHRTLGQIIDQWEQRRASAVVGVV